jgi:uncharacterized protein YkwD
MLDLHNRARGLMHLKPLALDGRLNVAAQAHAYWLADHNEYLGDPHFDWENRWYAIPGHGQTGGENIMFTETMHQGRIAFVGWLKSQGHLGNILTPHFVVMGLGVCTRMFGVSASRAFWVAIFSTEMA